MNSFMNALWSDGVGKWVTGKYCGIPFEAKIQNVRAKYGNDISVELRTTDQTAYLINGSDLQNGSGGVFTNLHVYF